MLVITYKDNSIKQFSLKDKNRENTFFVMWQWCSKHAPEKKLKVTTKSETFLVVLGDLLLVELI